MTRTHRRLATTALAAVLALATPALVSCGGVAESAVEKAAEAAVGGNVDITEDGLTVEGENGENLEVTEDGLTVEGENGDTLAIGGDAGLPENWPAAIPAVDGGTLASVMVSGDGATSNAIWMTDASVADAAAAYAAALSAAGFASSGDAISAADMMSNDYTGNGYTVNVVVATTGDQSSVMVNATKE